MATGFSDRFFCEKCPAVFSTITELRMHERNIHTTEFCSMICAICPLCGKSFHRQEMLRDHINVDHASSIVHCPHVGCTEKTFQSFDEFSKHMLEFHKSMLQCNICGEWFQHDDQLLQHALAKHNAGKNEIDLGLESSILVPLDEENVPQEDTDEMKIIVEQMKRMGF